VDTIRSCRSLAVAHQLGHVLMGEQDTKISLMQRCVEHALNTARYSVYYGKGRDAYDVPGRTAHESVFNVTNGVYRCPNSQQGYSPFSTWTRGLAWAVCGFAELLEYVSSLSSAPFPTDAKKLADMLMSWISPKMEKWPLHAKTQVAFVEAAAATTGFYLDNCCADGIPMWDTGALNLHRLPPNYLNKPSNPYNVWEPVDSSAAAIASQGLIRLGNHLNAHSNGKMGARYLQAGLTIAHTLLSEPYLSTDAKHQGLLLHSVYHRPNGWDYIAPGQKVPNGESSMWGDYHLRELALLILREARGEHYLTFFGGVSNKS
jgi:hypothetical protein